MIGWHLKPRVTGEILAITFLSVVLFTSLLIRNLDGRVNIGLSMIRTPAMNFTNFDVTKSIAALLSEVKAGVGHFSGQVAAVVFPGQEVITDDMMNTPMAKTIPAVSERARLYANSKAKAAGVSTVTSSGGESAFTAQDAVGQSFPNNSIDGRVARLIRESFIHDPNVDGSLIRVSGNNSLIKLAGVVVSDKERQAAERDVRNIKGVVGVDNNIKVRTGIASRLHI
jgi:osmotically-inducible protein OsmY